MASHQPTAIRLSTLYSACASPDVHAEGKVAQVHEARDHAAVAAAGGPRLRLHPQDQESVRSDHGRH